MTITESKHNEKQSTATPVETELRAQIAAMQQQITEMHTTQERNAPDNPVLISKVQTLKWKNT